MDAVKQLDRYVTSSPRLKPGASSFFFPLLFIPHGLERFAGSMLSHEVPAFSLPLRRCVPASYAGSGASQLPHPMPLVKAWANALRHPCGLGTSDLRQKYFRRDIFKFCPFIPEQALGFLGTNLIKLSMDDVSITVMILTISSSTVFL